MAGLEQHRLFGLSALGYICYAILWVAQGAVFWRGMEAIRRFIDWAGPAVYLVMVVLAVYLVSKAGWSHISLNLAAGKRLDLFHSITTTINAVALVVAYFAGYYLVSRQRVWADDLYTRSPSGRYWFSKGYNPNAIRATIIGGVPAIASVLIPSAAPSLNVGWISDYSWFIGCGPGFLAFLLLERTSPMITDLDREVELAADGKAPSAAKALPALRLPSR